jgi:hypothetical protein
VELSLLGLKILTVDEEYEEDEWEEEKSNGPTLLGFDNG